MNYLSAQQLLTRLGKWTWAAEKSYVDPTFKREELGEDSIQSTRFLHFFFCFPGEKSANLLKGVEMRLGT